MENEFGNAIITNILSIMKNRIINMTSRITIIGAGPGGYAAALRAARLGAKVSLVERDQIGGTCLNRGCIPSKTMKTAAEILENLGHAKEFGINCKNSPSLDIRRLMEKKDRVIQTLNQGMRGQLKEQNVTILKGEGFVKRYGLLSVRHADGSTKEVQWDRLILSTGSEPGGIPSIPYDGDRIISSDDILNISEIPKSIIIVGGGVIGCEFASIFSAFGSRVTIVEALSRLLPLSSVDDACSKTLQREMKKRKIAVNLNSTVEKVDTKGERVVVTIIPVISEKNSEKKNLKPVELETGKVLICTGRRSNIAGMGFENISLKLDSSGWVFVDQHMQTGAEGVYAVGDMLGPEKVMLAHMASAEGLVAADNSMGKKTEIDYSAVPNAIFTIPEVACVGLTGAQACERGLNSRADSILFRTLGKAQATGELAGEAKIISDVETGLIIGVHLIGSHATDLIAEGTLAVKNGITLKELAATIHAHPTIAEVMAEVARKALDE